MFAKVVRGPMRGPTRMLLNETASLSKNISNINKPPPPVKPTQKPSVHSSSKDANKGDAAKTTPPASKPEPVVTPPPPPSAQPSKSQAFASTQQAQVFQPQPQYGDFSQMSGPCMQYSAPMPMQSCSAVCPCPYCQNQALNSCCQVSAMPQMQPFPAMQEMPTMQAMPAMPVVSCQGSPQCTPACQQCVPICQQCTQACQQCPSVCQQGCPQCCCSTPITCPLCCGGASYPQTCYSQPAMYTSPPSFAQACQPCMCGNPCCCNVQYTEQDQEIQQQTQQQQTQQQQKQPATPAQEKPAAAKPKKCNEIF